MARNDATQNKGAVRKLGRGIGSLISVPNASGAEIQSRPSPSSTEIIQMIVIEAIAVSPFQPRKTMIQATIEQLADSIRHSGVMQPIIVREIKGGFELVAGERRWRAAQLAGLASVPAIVRLLTDEQSAEWGLVENVQREDLNPIERGVALKQLIAKFGLSAAQLSERVGLDRSTITNLMRLTELEQEITEMIARGDLSGGHGKALLAIPPGEARLSLAREAAVGGWNVRKVEMLAKAHAVSPENIGTKAVKDEEARARHAVLRDLERRIGEKLSTKVLITTDRSGAKGKLSIEFYSIDHFDGLLSRLGIQSQ